MVNARAIIIACRGNFRRPGTGFVLHAIINGVITRRLLITIPQRFINRLGKDKRLLWFITMLKTRNAVVPPEMKSAIITR